MACSPTNSAIGDDAGTLVIVSRTVFRWYLKVNTELSFAKNFFRISSPASHQLFKVLAFLNFRLETFALLRLFHCGISLGLCHGGGYVSVVSASCRKGQLLGRGG